jgi:ABC-2 type transport system permease protein
MVQTAIATAFERQYGVLKRLGVTPLGRPRLLGAKIAGVLVVELVQVIVLGATAVALGWEPTAGSVATVALAVVVATAAFAGLGLLMAGTLPGDVTLAAANGLYLVLLLVGGMVVPLEELPGWVEAVARLLPTAALTDILLDATGATETATAGQWAVLLAWAVAAPTAAALTFRWSVR